MSHAATNWAIEQRGLRPAAKIVLWHLCDRYNPDKGCFPEQERLAVDCEMSRSSLNNQMETLEKEGLIYRERRTDPETRKQRSTRYRFPFEDDFPCPKSGHGSNPETVSKKALIPCPKNGESRVQNLDTNPVREPVREPVKGESARASDSGLGEIDTIEPLTPKQIETAFKRTFHRWPSFVTDSEPEARKAWARLSDDERRAAEDRLSDYVAAGDKLGRKKFCAFAVYLRETRWDRLAPKAPTVPDTHVSAKPHGKPWNAKRLAELCHGPCDIPPPGTAFLRRQLAADEKLQRLRLIELGYPVVNEMAARGQQGHAYRVPAEFVVISQGFQECAVDDDNPLWKAWQDLHASRDWPLMDRPPSGFVWLPVPRDADGCNDMTVFVRDALARFETDLADLDEGKSDDERAA